MALPTVRRLAGLVKDRNGWSLLAQYLNSGTGRFFVCICMEDKGETVLCGNGLCLNV